MTDRQTTGGYPKIATVISADLPALGRLYVGAKVRFEAVSVADAHALRRHMLSTLEGLKDCVVPISSPGMPTIAELLDCNLISGVVDARHGADS
jgi:5-oxoprolinase (ATP-hydrolysing) subunit C